MDYLKLIQFVQRSLGVLRRNCMGELIFSENIYI